MTKPMIRIHNTETDEIIDREMNDNEFAAFQTVQAKYAAEQAEAQEKADAKAELLERLGITEDEAKLLLS
jgi:hypothetical protein